MRFPQPRQLIKCIWNTFGDLTGNSANTETIKGAYIVSQRYFDNKKESSSILFPNIHNLILQSEEDAWELLWNINFNRNINFSKIISRGEKAEGLLQE